MNNVCQFSPCRRYRYSLEHRFDELLTAPPRLLPWIGLNPSTADEGHLDNTLKKIRKFTLRALWRDLPFDGFVMLNLFAFRATQPEDMMREADPVGPDNDAAILQRAQSVGCVIACWGADGTFHARDQAVIATLRRLGVEVLCLGVTKDGQPRHPLYMKDSSVFRVLT